MGVTMNLAYLFAGTISPNPQMLVAETALVFAGTAVGYYGLDRYLLPAIGQRFGWTAAWGRAMHPKPDTYRYRHSSRTQPSTYSQPIMWCSYAAAVSVAP